MEERILIKRYEGAINNEVARLRDKRRGDANGWNEFKEAFAAYEGSFSYISLKTFLNHNDPKSFLVDKFIKNQNLGGIPIKADKLEEFLDIPPYQHLLNYREQFKEWSVEDMDVYFDKKAKSFVAPPITNAEKEAIIEANSIYAHSEREVQYVKDLEGFCNTIEYLQRINAPIQVHIFRNAIRPIEGKLRHITIGGTNKWGVVVNYRKVLPM